MSRPEFKKVILFDGACNLCNSAVTFVIDRDRKDVFRFVPLQTEVGARLAEYTQTPSSEIASIVLIDGDRHFTRSSAVLRVARELPGYYPLLYWFIAIPRVIRDAVYDLVARNRFAWFGRRDTCMLPTPGVRRTFLA